MAAIIRVLLGVIMLGQFGSELPEYTLTWRQPGELQISSYEYDGLRHLYVTDEKHDVFISMGRTPEGFTLLIRTPKGEFFLREPGAPIVPTMPNGLRMRLETASLFQRCIGAGAVIAENDWCALLDGDSNGTIDLADWTKLVDRWLMEAGQ